MISNRLVDKQETTPSPKPVTASPACEDLSIFPPVVASPACTSLCISFPTNGQLTVSPACSDLSIYNPTNYQPAFNRVKASPASRNILSPEELEEVKKRVKERAPNEDAKINKQKNKP